MTADRARGINTGKALEWARNDGNQQWQFVKMGSGGGDCGSLTLEQKVVVRGSGSMNANQSLDLPSYTTLEVCGTIGVSGTISANNAVVRAQNVTDVEVTRLNVTGSPYFGVFIRNGANITLGRIPAR